MAKYRKRLEVAERNSGWGSRADCRGADPRRVGRLRGHGEAGGLASGRRMLWHTRLCAADFPDLLVSSGVDRAPRPPGLQKLVDGGSVGDGQRAARPAPSLPLQRPPFSPQPRRVEPPVLRGHVRSDPCPSAQSRGDSNVPAGGSSELCARGSLWELLGGESPRPAGSWRAHGPAGEHRRLGPWRGGHLWPAARQPWGENARSGGR